MKEFVNQQGRRKGLVLTPDNLPVVLEICNQNYIQLKLLSKLQSKLQITQNGCPSLISLEIRTSSTKRLSLHHFCSFSFLSFGQAR